jgi:ribosomal protein S18 acetylase RimI-like enzyme
MGVTVREARPEEYDAIAEVTVAAYARFPETGEDPEYLAEQRDVAGRALLCPIYVAIDDETGDVLGGATYVPSHDNKWAEAEREGEAGIRLLAVAPRAQGRGIGTALTNALVGRAQDEGKRGITLLTLPAMTAAQRMYERLGFQRDPERDWEPVPGLLLIGYAKRLSDRTVGSDR